MPLGGFFVLTIAGILAGFVYEIGVVVKLIFKNRIWAMVVIDFFAAAAMGALFVAAEILYLNFRIFGFGVASFVFGIVIERISIGFLLAKILSGVYNKVGKVVAKFQKTKIGTKLLK